MANELRLLDPRKCGVCRDAPAPAPAPATGLLFCAACTRSWDRLNAKEPDTLQVLEWLARRVWRFANSTRQVYSHQRKLLRALAQAQDLFGQVESAYANDRAPDRADQVHTLARKGFRVCLAALGPYPPRQGG